MRRRPNRSVHPPGRGRRRNHTGRGRGSQEGFTLLELLAGIAVASLLIVSVFQVTTHYLTLNERLRTETTREQKNLVVRRLLREDLTARPVGKPRLKGRQRELYRTTARYESEKLLLMDTRVHYFVESRRGTPRLVREWKWTDIHTEYREPEILLRGGEIRFQYRGTGEEWYENTNRPDTVTAVRLRWGEQEFDIFLR